MTVSAALTVYRSLIPQAGHLKYLGSVRELEAKFLGTARTIVYSDKARGDVTPTSAARASSRASPGAESKGSTGKGKKGNEEMQKIAKILSEKAGKDEKSLSTPARALNYLTSKWKDNADKPKFQAGLQALMGARNTLITMEQFSHWLVTAAVHETLYKAVSKYQNLTEPSDKTPLKTLLNMAYKTAVQGILRLKVAADGISKDVVELYDEILPYGTKHLLDLRRNGAVEVTADYGPRDCVIVAFNNAYGGVFLLRNTVAYTTSSIMPLSIANIESRFAEGDLCIDKLLPIINNKKRTPFVVTKDNDLSGKFDVFLKPVGIYVIALVLVDTDGNIDSHAVTLDCERNYVNFGYGADSDGQIVLHFAGPAGEGDRRDVDQVKMVLVDYFKNLKEIVVADVLKVQVKAKALRYAPDVAYKIQGRPLEESTDERATKRHC